MVGLIAVVASVVISWISYRFIEQPFRAKPPNGFTRNMIFLLSGAALSGMIVFGGVLHISNGLTSRIPAHVLEITEASENYNSDRAVCFGTLPEDGLCPVGVSAGDGAPVDVLFWGDSHAEAMRYGVDLATLAEGQSGVFAGTSGCLPIRQLKRSPENRKCTEMNDAVWAFLEARDNVPVVVLAARWTLSVEGTRYRQEAGSPVILEWAGNADAEPSSDDNASLMESGLMATVADIIATGRNVIILGPIPEVGFDVPNLLARRQMLSWLAPAPELTEANFVERAATTEDILMRVAANYDGARYLRLSDLFCADGTCSLTDKNGLPLYVDDDHITRQAAGALLPERLSEIWTNTD